MKLYKIRAAIHADATKPINAIAMDLRIGTSFSFLSSNSRAASNTIIINPTIPRTSKIGKKFKESALKYFRAYCNITPKTMSIRTAGIFVFFDIPLKRKDKIMITDTSIIR
ncbi:hypothetical protein GCM10007384_34160 [Aquimarina muelleri]|uniref:Uncharacterized protein n=1 Tax=Aquimarina muelleri TaxID=279356 RepID=A0A918JZ30_9FLAO|nr:hypothetical protein GCM10007384_34160 [Aquimarina muelleri]